MRIVAVLEGHMWMPCLLVNSLELVVGANFFRISMVHYCSLSCQKKHGSTNASKRGRSSAITEIDSSENEN